MELKTTVVNPKPASPRGAGFARGATVCSGTSSLRSVCQYTAEIPRSRYNSLVPFQGLRVLALESRRATEMAELIRRQGGDPFVAPSMREAPLEESAELNRFAERLFAGGFDMMALLTGVGTRQLNRWLAARYSESAFADALRRMTVAARSAEPRSEEHTSELQSLRHLVC